MENIIDLEIIEDIEQSGASSIALVDMPAIEKNWMAFKKEVFVTPGSGESQDEFIPRCIAKLVGDEGYETDQAAAICYSTYREKHATEEFAASYTDYPQAARDAARRALDWAEENGWGSCGTPIGKARANQLASGRPITEETIARMASFARHRQNSDTPYGEGCGKLMWDAWGGDSGIAWAQRKLEQIRRQEMSYDVSALPPYVEEVPKKKVKMETTELDIYGYRTSDFHMCPGAVATFQHLMEMSPDEDTIGMIRAAAVIADRVFDLEEEVLEEGVASFNDVREAVVLVDDFYDVMQEIDKALGMEHNIDYMIGHVEKIQELYAEPEAFAAPASGKPGDRPLARIPKEERGRTGSEKNEPGDTKTTRGGIEVSAEVEKTLKDKIEKHNEANPQESQKATLGMLKAVWRRGAGAYSVGTPGKRGMTRSQWAMARVNSFLNILAGNKSGYDKDYNQDNDLLPKGHPKHSEEKMSKLYFASEDQRVVIGPVMIPDLVIPRVDPDTKERYAVRFSAETISKVAEKFMRQLRNASTNIEHDTEVDGGSYIKESWIVETEDDKANSKYGLEVPVGTWMVAMRVQDPSVWKQIKAGELNGFSVEGDFMDRKDYEQYQKDKEIYNKVMKILKSM